MRRKRRSRAIDRYRIEQIEANMEKEIREFHPIRTTSVFKTRKTMSETKRPTCATCPYWDDKGYDVRLKEPVGDCRRHAPRATRETVDDFATTVQNEWCGDHPGFVDYILPWREITVPLSPPVNHVQPIDATSDGSYSWKDSDGTGVVKIGTADEPDEEKGITPDSTVHQEALERISDLDLVPKIEGSARKFDAGFHKALWKTAVNIAREALGKEKLGNE
jgi:hypothetical protein